MIPFVLKTIPPLPKPKTDEELAKERDRQELELVRLCRSRNIPVKQVSLEAYCADFILVITDEMRTEHERKKREAIEKFGKSA